MPDVEPTSNIETIIEQVAQEIVPVDLQKKLREEISAVTEHLRTIVNYVSETGKPGIDVHSLIRDQLKIWMQSKAIDSEYDRYRALMKQLERIPINRRIFVTVRGNTPIYIRFRAIFDRGLTVGTEVICHDGEKGVVQSISTDGMLIIRRTDGERNYRDPSHMISRNTLCKTCSQELAAQQKQS